MLPNKLPKQERLCNKTAIDTLFAKNSLNLFSYPFRISYTKKGVYDTVAPKVLFSVPKRAFKKAHDRNWLKRRMKEAYRLQKMLLLNDTGETQIATIAIALIAKERVLYDLIESKMIKLLRMLEKVA